MLNDDVLEPANYIFLEYVHGMAQLSRKNFTEKRFAQLCKALDATHAAGVLHNDVRLENIMVLPEGKMILLDFGLAKTYNSGGTTLRQRDEFFEEMMALEELGKALVCGPRVFLTCANMLSRDPSKSKTRRAKTTKISPRSPFI